jgi:hypothetical protein
MKVIIIIVGVVILFAAFAWKSRTCDVGEWKTSHVFIYLLFTVLYTLCVLILAPNGPDDWKVKSHDEIENHL